MKKIFKVLIFALIAVMLFGAVSASAFDSYETYTYSIDGDPLKSPMAYKADAVYGALDMELGKVSPELPNFNGATDVVADNNGDIYITDKGNNRVVILDKYYSAKATISAYRDEYGVEKTLLNPTGIFVTNPEITADGSSFIFVCSLGNETTPASIVVFDRDYNYVKTIEEPDTPLLQEGAFKPNAIAVDIYGRIFITSSSCFEGVIVLSNEGDFTGFIGSQKVTYSVIELIWRRFQSAEQRQSAVKKLANPYNNITVDDEGFVYVTTLMSGAEMKNQLQAIKSKSAASSPVKKLNSAGDEIMKRNGFFDPGGEVDVYNPSDVSKIVDVAVGREGSWSILDTSRSRVFTYDQNGNLLFAFGSVGGQLGNLESAVGMTYHKIDGVYHLVVLDNNTNGYRITVYSPTKYCDSIMAALRNQNENNYSESIFYWQDVLTQNNNFDLAYIGIGKSLFNQGKYQEAQDMLASAYETNYHDKAFKEIRDAIIQKWMLPLLVVVIAIIVLFLKFLGYAKKRNKAVSLKVGKKTYWEELLFAFHLVFHPFDGFWDLKHEKRGSVRASFTIMGITILAFFYQAIGRGYSFNPRGDYSTVAIQVIGVAVPILLWCVGNWCLTTLFDGEGSFKDIFIATGYSLAPLPLFIILSTILTNLMTSSEGSIVNLLVTFGYVWVGILLFFGMSVTHDYSNGKNFITVLGTIVAMAIIIFIVVLFASLVAKIVAFIIAIVSEVAGRV